MSFSPFQICEFLRERKRFLERENPLGVLENSSGVLESSFQKLGNLGDSDP